MPGSDLESTHSTTLHNSEDPFDLQSPKFYKTEDDLIQENTFSINEELYDVEASEHSTQLEELQQLLEIANQNEACAKINLAEMRTKLETSKRNLEEIRLQSDKSKAQAKSTIDYLQTTIKSLSNQHDTIVRERDQAISLQKEEKSKNVTLQLNMNELKQDHEQLSANYAKKLQENTNLKKVILKQNGEIERLKILLENKQLFSHPVPFGGHTFFRDTNELSRPPEINVLFPTKNIHKNW